MFVQTRSAAALALALSTLTGTASALYDANGKTNLAMYWGQGPGQLDLLHYCQQASVDLIPIGFINRFPDQGNGYAGSNFGNKCGAAVYAGPGSNPANDNLLSSCPSINHDIPICQQTYGKKIILSLGGGTNDYQLTGEAAGLEFADFLWGAYGPRTAAWVDAGKPRPFDGEDGEEVQVDGFDLDIEYQSTDGSAGYIALLRRLRELFATGNKQYIISGAPQCVVPDANMATMISAAQFDVIFIQFYNTPYCSARNYITTGGTNSGFSYDEWTTFLQGTASANAKLYIGLPGSPAAAGGGGTFWLTPAETKELVEDFYCRDNFGGVMLWESTRAEGQIDGGMTYYQNVAQVLSEVAADTALECVAGQSSSSVSSSSRITSTSTLTVMSTSTSSVVTTSSTTLAVPSITGGVFDEIPESSTSPSSTSLSVATSSSILASSSTTTISSSSFGVSISALWSNTSSTGSFSSGSVAVSPSSVSFETSATLSRSSSVAVSTSGLPIPSSSVAVSASSVAIGTVATPIIPPSSNVASLPAIGFETTFATTFYITLSPIAKPTSVPSSSLPLASPIISSSSPPLASSIISSIISSSPSSLPTLRISTDGSCGTTTSCGSSLCCSRFGWCGSSSDYCAAGCQAGFGRCDVVVVSSPSSSPPASSPSASAAPVSAYPVSQDGSCGSAVGKSCGSGNCCSKWGWCGSGALYCGADNCQVGFGRCA